MTQAIATENAPQAIGPYIQGVRSGNFFLHLVSYPSIRKRALFPSAPKARPDRASRIFRQSLRPAA